MTTDSGVGTEPTAALPVQGAGEPTVVYVKQPRQWAGRFLAFIGVLGLLVAAFFGLQALNILPRFSNPFATQTTDRTGPVLLTSVKDLSRYVAAEGEFQVLVDLQQNNKYIPDFLYNERTLFVGVGSVDAYVDFSKLTDGDIKVSPDGKSVEITLPKPTLDKPNLDTAKSYVFAQDQGIANKIGNLFNDDPNKQQQLYQDADQKIADAATSSGLLDRAETNTKAMLTSMLTQLGFDRVTITFSTATTP